MAKMPWCGELVPAALLLVGISCRGRAAADPPVAPLAEDVEAAVDPSPPSPTFTSPLPVDVCSEEVSIDPGMKRKWIEKTYVCGELLRATGNLLNLLRDPWTGLPYDSIPCGGPCAADPTAANPAWGVVPQLAFADISPFAEDAARTRTTIEWAFVDRAPDETFPSLLWALKIALHLDVGGDSGAENLFGGLLWQAKADIRRYAQVRIRYRTSEAASAWQLKLNSGTTRTAEPAVVLSGSTAWTDRTFAIATDFPGTDTSHLNYLAFASSVAASGANPTIWIDQVSFVSDPARQADCDVPCPSTLSPYPDLACNEPQTGVVSIANALTFFSAAPAAALLDEATAKQGATRILASMESFPGARAATRANGLPYPGGGWFQDWHSPVSMMPSPHNRAASLTNQPQLYAALMVVESTWPDLTLRAQALRNKMDFSVLYDDRSGCPGSLISGFDRCAGLSADRAVDRFGTDDLLGAFLAGATGEVPLCFWTTGLSRRGCALTGRKGAPWYDAGDLCANAALPASDGGGPFLQLAGLLYLASDQIPMGSLSLGASARNMLRAQYDFARENNLTLAGWSNASDPDACASVTCQGFAPEKVTPYVSGMAASDEFPAAYSMLRAFHLLGADAWLDTGSDNVGLGLRDGYDQASARARASYRYLATGWTGLGLLNACHGDLVRRRFGQHPVARAGYALLQSGALPCP